MTPKILTSFLITCLFVPFSFGQITFEKTYTQSGEGTSIEQTPDGNFLLKGADFVTKTDANGNEISTRQLNDPMLGFNTTSDDGFIKIATVQINQPFNNHTDIRLIKTDANEQEEWSTQVGDFMSETPQAVMQASDGGYLIAGSTDLIDPTQLDGYTYIGATALKHYFVSNTKSSMDDLNNNTLPEYANLASIEDPGELYVILNGINEMVYIGMNDLAVEGELVWENGTSVNYTNFDICDFCEENADDKDYVIMNHWNGGWSYSSQYAARKHIIELPCGSFYRPVATTRNEDTDLAQDKFPQLIPTVACIELASVYPNPSRDEISLKIKSELETSVQLNIIDGMGRIVMTQSINLTNGLNINRLDLSKLNQGGFYIQIINGNENPILEKFIKL